MEDNINYHKMSFRTAILNFFFSRGPQTYGCDVQQAATDLENGKQKLVIKL